MVIHHHKDVGDHILEDLKDKTMLGFVEEIVVMGVDSEEKLVARIDSGATKSSIDIALASKLKLGPVVASRLVKSANGAKLRPMVDVTIKMCGREVTGRYTLADRSHMKYKVLIGQDVLRQNFIIDPNKYSDKDIKEINNKFSVKEE